MRSVIRSIRFGFIIATAVMLFGTMAAPARAQTGAVHLKVVKAGFIVGVGRGSGTLFYQGVRYPLRVGGIGIGPIGIAGVELVGTAYNLQTAADIAGTYGAAGAEVTFVGGAQVARLQNEKGVVLEVHGVQAGSQLFLGLAGKTTSFR